MGHKFNANSRAKTRCHIIRQDNNNRMTFQFNPESVPYSRGANYSTLISGHELSLTQYVGVK